LRAEEEGMQESAAGQRRRWADIVVILVGLALVGLAAWNAPISAGAEPDETRSIPSIYMAYAVGGGLALAAVFAVHRWKGVGRLLLLAAALVLLGYGVAGYQQGEALWLTVVLPGLLLLGAAPFFGPMPRANP
jgi:peptidoglycan/LPS O-acetylase OafA/YrhL